MKLLKTVFLFEWQQFLRVKAMLMSLSFFLILGAFSIYSGNTVIRDQLTVIDSLNSSYQKDFQESLKQVSDSSSPAALEKAKNAGNPALINFQLPQNAVNYPKGLSALSIGQRDVNPYYQRVKSNVTFLDESNIEISNPALLSAGNFDLAFVITYLLPLLVIAFCYNVLSFEKEAGTYSLLALQGSIHKIIIYKLLFRLLIILAPLLALNLVGMVFSSGLPTPAPAALQWIFLNISYLLFWFSLCYMVVLFNLTSSRNALYLLGAWLVFIIILPAVSNIYVGVMHPVPLRADLASYERHLGEEIWNSRPKILIDAFHVQNPQYKGSYNPAVDTLAGSIRFFAAYYDQKERKVLDREAALDREIQKGNDLTTNLSLFNPAVQMQSLLNSIAGTGLKDFKDFQHQAAAFQKQWKSIIYTADLSGKTFTAEDLKRFPAFKMDQRTPATWYIIVGSLTFWSLSIVFVAVGTIKSKI